MSEVFLRELLTEDTDNAWRRPFKILQGLPHGAKFRGVFDLPGQGQIGLVFEHDTFEEVYEGNLPLSVDIMVQSVGWELYNTLWELYESRFLAADDPLLVELWERLRDVVGLKVSEDEHPGSDEEGPS